MCLILLAVERHPDYRMIIAANRDEYYDRPTMPASFWDEAPDLLAGRDLKGGGTWLGITVAGRFAAVTNYRAPGSNRPEAESRGRLVTDFLESDESPSRFMARLQSRKNAYNAFNLVFGSVRGGLFWYSNRAERGVSLSSGIFGLSNHLLDTPWPKVVKAKKAFTEIIDNEKEPAPGLFFEFLKDQTVADDADLPQTGVGLEWERTLSPVFITSPVYGTRSSTLVFVRRDDHILFLERTYNGTPGKGNTVRYEFTLSR